VKFTKKFLLEAIIKLYLAFGSVLMLPHFLNWAETHAPLGGAVFTIGYTLLFAFFMVYGRLE